MANPRLKDSDINHLRRLLGYVRCEIGQSPEEFMETMRKIAPACGEPDDGGKQRVVESYQKSQCVPKYVRAAVKALEKVVAEEAGQVVDADLVDRQNLVQGLTPYECPSCHRAERKPPGDCVDPWHAKYRPMLTPCGSRTPRGDAG